MAYTYFWGEGGGEPARIESRVLLKDAVRVVEIGRAFCHCLDSHADESSADSDPRALKLCQQWIEALLGAGFVMGDFDNNAFANGPLHLIFVPGVAAAVARAANILTVRMYLHTLQRGHRWVYYGSGLPYFYEAYASGGLRALLDRIHEYCVFAERQEWQDLQDHAELRVLKPTLN